MKPTQINLTLLLAFFYFFSGYSYSREYIPQEGDIIFHISQSSQSKAIQLATKSKYSHVGIIFFKDKKTFVFEAVQPVKFTPLEIWIKQGVNEHYVVKRLKKSDQVLTEEIINKMKLIGNKMLGINYDLYFEWSNDRIYCSELVWKLYKEGANVEVGQLEKMLNFDLSHEEVQKHLRIRFPKGIPKDEVVISPVSILNSENLVTVFRNGAT